MRFYKLRVTQNASSIASTFNESFKPEILPAATDPYSVDWITESTEDVIVGEKVAATLIAFPIHLLLVCEGPSPCRSARDGLYRPLAHTGGPI